MAVMMNEEDKENFRVGLQNLKSNVNDLSTQLSKAKEKLENSVGTTFKKQSNSGKKATTKLGEVITKLTNRKKDLNTLIDDLQSYLNKIEIM